jgi:TFIIF-interacting CTD phosphatase-like protein
MRTVKALDQNGHGLNGFFSHVLSFNECFYYRDDQYHLKDLIILGGGRNLCDIIIVDNTIESFYLQLSNGIPIHDFEGDPKDRALLHLTVYLK